MKKLVLFNILFALLVVSSFEASKHINKHFLSTRNIYLNSLVELSETDLVITDGEDTQVVESSEFKLIEKSLEIRKRLALRKHNYVPKKVVQKFVATTNKELNLKKYEISNEEMISLNAMSVPMIKTVAIASMLNGFTLPVENPVFEYDQKVVKTKKVEEKEVKVKEDKVNLSMSSVEKLDAQEEAMINALVNNVEIEETIADKKINKDEKKNDDLLFFDYSEDKEKKTEKKIVESATSILKDDMPQVISMIQKAQNDIKAQIEEGNKVTRQEIPTLPKIMPIQKEKSSTQKAFESEYAKKDDNVQSLMSSQKKNDYPRNAKLTIKTSLGVIGKSLKENTTQFQFISDVSFGEPVSSGSIGAIEIEEMINEKVSTIRGTILSSDTFPTIVELPLEYGDYLMNIPLLDRDNLFRKYEGIRGALLLVELDESTDSIDIDHKYIERVHLSETFKEVDEGDNYRFILFVGVEPGNTMIQYLTLNEEIGEKIVHLVEDHVFYESNTYLESRKEKIELFETKVLGKKDLELNIEPEDINYFNSNIKSKSIGINLYEMDVPIMPLGMRKYLELNHLGETIYAGYQDNHSIKVPSKEYLNYIMDTFEINSIENQCMLQINFEKPIVDFSYASESFKGPIPFEVLYLDKDGMFNEDASDYAKKVFLIGDTPGSVNIKVEYADNSKDYFQTFCSPNTFVVEQL